MDLGLRGKTVLVAGASGGIGATVARTFGAEGCNVAVHYSGHRESAEEVAARTEAAGGRACILRADISDPAQATDLVRQVVERFGALDVLVNCVGVNVRKHFFDVTDEEWDWLVRINLGGIFYLGRAAARAMMERHSGVIVNIGSSSGSAATITGAAYGATKSGVITLTKAMAAELAPFGVRAVALSPGLVATPMSAEFARKRGREITRAIPMARAGTPEEIASAIAFVASDRASYLTGVNVDVNGGKLAVQNPWMMWEGRELPDPA